MFTDISNTQVVQTLRLVDSIDLNPNNKEYNPDKVLIDFDIFKTSDKSQ